MSISDFLFGKPLATSEERAEHIGVASGIPIFGLDALTSAAYGPEAALTLLIPLGLFGLNYIVPVISAILVLLVIVYFSYRQTIEAYPNGGGSYTVASENLGNGAGLLAAAALMIDYVLTAAVGISAGVASLISAVPRLQPHTLALCLVILALLAIVNMRGVRDTGAAFMAPTFLFVGTLLAVVAVGVYRTLMSGGHPMPVVAPPPAAAATVKYLSVWLLAKVFSSGCTAMTGVEAVSNGVMAFGEPRTKNAQRTLTIIIAILIVLLAGIAYLVKAYDLVATDPGASDYQSVLSLLDRAVTGEKYGEIFAATAQLSKQEQESFENILALFYSLLTDLLESSEGSKSSLLRNPDLRKEVEVLSKKINWEWVLRATRGLDTLEGRMRRNIGRQLGLDSLVTSLSIR